jgi:CheY-like chemotaxis protein/anti-sigma regulatory factor (Ser/Thr protein kinase)
MVLWEGILRDEASDAALRRRALDAIKQSLVAQSRVVGDLLDISRAAAGKLRVDFREVDIEKVVCEAVDAIAPSAHAQQIELRLRGTTAGALVSGDAARLRQVLDNLLVNAVKFTDAGGRITVSVSSRGRSIAVEIADTGSGIAPELMPHLFDPFSQGDNTPARMDSGLGLGLAIARRLVELHRGTLAASSDGPGRGATLRIVLPTAVAATKVPSLVARAPDLVRTCVLVIDDDQRVREALAHLLARSGAVVETAESARVGRERIAHRAPEAVVCDIAMPGEDGYSFIRGLRASGSDVAAIALTARASESDVAEALAAGFDRHLAKPIDFERLLENLDELVVARRARLQDARS